MIYLTCNMKYTRAQHKQFLELELRAIAEKYRDLLNTKATVLRDHNELYVTQFVKIAHEDKNGGQLLLRFKKSNGIPRNNEYFTAVVLPLECCLPKSWGSLSWGDLRKKQIEFSEVHCTWQGKEDEKGLLLCGFKGLSVEMSDYLKTNIGCVVILGPQEPPIEYYQNLIDIVSIQDDNLLASILDFDDQVSKWNPHIIHKEFSSNDLLSALDESKNIIVQGPPGTGKTYRIAQMVASLLDRGASVLVTALTNRALMEVAEKDALKLHIVQGHISKTALTSDEHARMPLLLKADSSKIPCYKQHLTLSTFYISSSWSVITNDKPFDYVIMDEASQALLAMIGGVTRLGKHIIWIGDQNQLPPVVNLGEDIIARNDFNALVDGFHSLCENLSFKSYMLSDTFRLQPFSAKLTSSFYPSELNSCFDEDVFPKDEALFQKDKNVSYIPIQYKTGDKYIEEHIPEVIKIVDKILKKSPEAKIAILSKFRATVRSLQRTFISEYGNKENLLIDTVERVQGITRDFCIFVIPDYIKNLSLNERLFNVATSRATQGTIIVGPKNILSASLPHNVHRYLSHLIGADERDEIMSEEPSAIPGVKVVGKIDLSQFERPKKELSKTKANYYIIDTNVFVNYPDILSKIDVKYPIILSAKVVDELDKMKIKLTEQEKRNAEKALRLLNQDKRHQIIYESADVSLLPTDFDKRSPDNMILSVALKYKEENPIMLTSDNGLQLKCKTQGISTVSLKDFLKR